MRLGLRFSLLYPFCLLLALAFGCRPFICENKGGTQASIRCLATTPKEDIEQSESVKSYLAHNSVYVSLTTSPKRLSQITAMLQTLDLSYVAKIFVVLPERFGKEASVYDQGDIEQVRRFSKKLEIVRIRKDFGPITKILGIFGEVYEGNESTRAALSNPNNIVISVDDDIGYAAGMLGQLIKQVILLNAQGTPSIAGGWGDSISYFSLPPVLWPAKVLGCNQTKGFCDLVEGYGGIAYPVWILQKYSEKMLRLASENSSCFVSDDLVINYVLAKEGVRRMVVSNHYNPGLARFSYGLESDALHKAQGGHTPKYAKCLAFMAAR